MLKTFVRPILENAAVVWYGCTSSDFDKSEINQRKYNYMQQVTGLPILVPNESLYFETGINHYSKEEKKPS